jgi:hypothetical protein
MISRGSNEGELISHFDMERKAFLGASVQNNRRPLLLRAAAYVIYEMPSE